MPPAPPLPNSLPPLPLRSSLSVRAKRRMLRAERAEKQPGRTPVLSLSLGAREAPHASRRAREKQLSRTPLFALLSRCARSAARFAPSARKAVQPHARKYVELSDFGTIRSRSTKEMEAHKELTEQARAFPGRSASGPAITSRACANESLQPRAEGAARPSHSPARNRPA